MKANKFFAVALAALTLVSFNACKNNDDPETPTEEATLALNPTSLTLSAGEEGTIEATVEATWVSSDAEVATVAGNGKTATVKAIKEGNAVISATTAGGQTKTCVVVVKKAGGGETGAAVKGTQIWPIIMDGTTLEANASKVVASFQPNDVDQFLYVWDGTYVGADATGLNFHGNGDGYTALTVTTLGWAGMGYCLTASGNGWEAAEALRAAIVANPDQYYLHLAIKSADNYSHCFYFMGLESTKFVLGPTAVYDGPIYANFDRDGAWHEFDIPMSAYASALAGGTVAAGVNVFVALTEGVQGAALNLDAVYFYKK
ncbi:MAG: Ig domain-containing protein [Paludibacteraceae bacterium]|nr:Ig domain-containing protein [Paludibacteraceae bacterium]